MGPIASSTGPLHIAVSLAAALVLLLAAFAALLGVAVGSDACAGGDRASPSTEADRAIPPGYLAAYRMVGSEFGVPWPVLAAIGAIETDHGRSTAPGVHSGVNSYGCCAGPMQFNLTDGPPSTWERSSVDGNHDGTKDVYDPDDAIHSAGNYLRTLLRDGDGDIRQAIFGYNHSYAYVNDVLARARTYAGDVPVATDSCASGIDAPVGPADVRAAQRLTAPRAFKTLPPWAMAGGRASEAVDARIHDDVIWILRRYHLRVTAAREPGHHTHGDGTAVDLIPADGSTQPEWDGSAGRPPTTSAGRQSAHAPAADQPARSRPPSSSSATTATPATAHRAPAVAPAARTCTSRGSRPASAQVASPRHANGWPPSPLERRLRRDELTSCPVRRATAPVRPRSHE